MPGTVLEQFQQHATWSKLDQIETSLSNTEELLDGHGPEVISAHASLTSLAGHARYVLDATNPVLVPTPALDVVAQSLEQFSARIHEFAADADDGGPLLTGWTEAIALLTAIAGLPTIKTLPDLGTLMDAVRNFHQRLNEQLDDISQCSDNMRESLEIMKQNRDELADEIAEQKGTLAEAITSFRDQADSDRTERSSEYQAALDELRAAQATFTQESTDQRTEAQKAYDAQAEEFRAEFDGQISEWNSTSDELITALQAQLGHAKDLVEMIGEVTMTGHYQKNAIEQKKDADRWRVATVVAGALAVISAIAVTVGELFFAQDSSWIDILSRSTITLALTGLAAFLGSQSLRHRRREEDYRALELELATLDPFLNSLDDNERQRIKAELALRYFKGIDRGPIKLDDNNET